MSDNVRIVRIFIRSFDREIRLRFRCALFFFVSPVQTAHRFRAIRFPGILISEMPMSIQQIRFAIQHSPDALDSGFLNNMQPVFPTLNISMVYVLT